MTQLFSGESRRHRRARFITGLTSATLMLALAGCSPSSPADTESAAAETPSRSASATATSTPTPTETAVPLSDYNPSAPEPTSQAEALAAAGLAAQRYIELLNAGSIDQVVSPLLDEVALVGEPAYLDAVTAVTTVVDNSYTVVGGATLEILSGYTSPLQGSSAEYPTITYGFADITACFDSSARTITMADGTPAPAAPQQRSERTFGVMYNPELGGWRVRLFDADLEKAC